MIGQRRHWKTAPWLTPVQGAVVGAVGGGVFWLGAQVWPASIAVIVSMVATQLLGSPAWAHSGGARSAESPALWLVFAVLVKYNALMALSAASLPFPLPANVALGLIMIAGQSCSRALGVSVFKPAAYGDLGVAFAIGFAPAVLLGMPGLVGLATAIVARIALVGIQRRSGAPPAGQDMAVVQLAEVSFYLGAAAAWAYA
jgi:cobalamin synthase